MISLFWNRNSLRIKELESPCKACVLHCVEHNVTHWDRCSEGDVYRFEPYLVVVNPKRSLDNLRVYPYRVTEHSKFRLK